VVFLFLFLSFHSALFPWLKRDSSSPPSLLPSFLHAGSTTCAIFLPPRLPLLSPRKTTCKTTITTTSPLAPARSVQQAVGNEGDGEGRGKRARMLSLPHHAP